MPSLTTLVVLSSTVYNTFPASHTSAKNIFRFSTDNKSQVDFLDFDGFCGFRAMPET